jgi:hypothetical protein
VFGVPSLPLQARRQPLVETSVLVQHFEDSTTPVARTDFSDGLAWQHVVVEVTKDADVDGDAESMPEASGDEPLTVVQCRSER